MTTDPTIREQSYRSFLQEAPELLQAIEQELFSLQKGYSIKKIHSLMRAVHTLKGAAASVGLETLKSVAHSLEDIFRAICKPELVIDAEVEALLFEAYECLRLPLTAAITGGQVNNAQVLDRTAAVFALLQEKLGDCFAEDADLPSSDELGFDLTQSIFEFGVSQRLDELTAAVASNDPTIIATTLRVSAEVFQGLAESLKLPGFGAIASAAIAALDAHPEQAVIIGKAALGDFQTAQVAVLNGDRSRGGEPSALLQQLSVVNDTASTEGELTNSLLESIWGGAETSITEVSSASEMMGGQSSSSLSSPTPLPSPEEPAVTVIPSTPRLERDPTHIFAKDPVSLSHSVRVNVEHLEQINYSIEELLTNQNRQALQNEQLRTAVRVLLSRLKQHYSLLDQLKDKSDRLFSDFRFSFADFGLELNEVAPEFFPTRAKPDHGNNPKSIDRFDSLELNRYSESQVLIQSILEDGVQLAEAADAIDLFTHQSNQTLQKQRRLLSTTRDALMAARMSPLGELFYRFPLVLQQLEIIHKKPLTLELRGSEVLVDKVVVEKLYDPLLHLVRNAFDHGIESPAIRQQRGKPEKGQIEICAYHRGRYLVIEVRDDGQGLDFEQIRAAAVKNQFVANANTLTEAELTDLLFEPGFSTASEVSDLSGRGVGLDVVRTQLQTLQGSIAVCSERHQGTTFILQIPLSLTIAKLLQARSGGQIYALFTDAIEQILIPQPDQIRSWEGGKVLRWGNDGVDALGAASRRDEELVPIHQLSQVLNYSSHPKPSASQLVSPEQVMPVIIIRYQDALLGLEVDELLGEQELVIRPLGRMIAPPSYIYGGSLLPDGRLTLVLDGAALIQYVLKQQSDAFGGLDQPNSSSLRDSYVIDAAVYTDTRHHLPSAKPPILPPSQKQRQLPPPPVDLNFRTRVEKTVLVVDDSITVRQTLALTLQKAGYQVVQAKDGYEAINQFRQHTGIELVICDIEMPRMNGFEFLKHRQQDAALIKIPVVMLTSRSAEKHRLIASHLGATDYITKPYLEQKLLATVKELLHKKGLNSVFV